MKLEITCPSGHSVKSVDVHSTVKLVERDIYEAVVFECPGGKRGHSFTLKKGIEKGTFTAAEAAKIAVAARKYQAQYAPKRGSK